ncbi:MAG TPA: hypothetical protein VEC99_13775 [Clostridia bacterium]|nr:hypothetical protein [Clostridia bacterium]
MILIPVIERELRAAARNSFTYSLRIIGVALLLAVFGFTAVEEGLGRDSGGRLFSYLHSALFITIWALVPLLTADCISRERREGTLPLLFLTPLRPNEMVYAKGMANGLRGMTLWLAVLPILTIPFLSGGVGWHEVILSVLANFSSICLAMTAGLAASCSSKSWTRAMATALCLSCLFWLLYLAALAWFLSVFFGTGPRNPFLPFVARSDAPSLVRGFALATNYDGVWQQMSGVFRRGTQPLLSAFAASAMVSVLTSLLLARYAAWKVSRVWRETPPSARVLWLQQKLFSPVLFQSLLKRWLRRTLEHNPIGWLEQRSWSGRLVVWSWLAVVVCIYSSLFANFYLYQRGFHDAQNFLASLLAVSMALSAAGSFRRERETGVLELLLVAPIQEWHIIRGRLLGLWTQFTPAIALLFLVWTYCGSFFSLNPSQEYVSVLLHLVTFATLPVVGLYFSLAKSNFIAALLWTLLTGWVVPYSLAQIIGLWKTWMFGPTFPSQLETWPALSPIIQILLAGILARRLHDNLKHRKFALDRP